MFAYFDNAATTQMCDAAASAFMETAARYGNPSSMHALGLDAEKLVSSAEKTICASLHADKSDAVIFTGSGTESNNTALFGAAYAKSANIGKRIIISDSEHPSVYEAAKQLSVRGFDVKYAGTKGGEIDRDELLSLMNGNTLLISIMAANNEHGALYGVEELCRAAHLKEPGVIFHTDATQAYLKTGINAKASGIDMITVSAHKVRGPKGVGALYVKDRVIRSRSVCPLVYGGGQGKGLRSGTENVQGIAAFEAAVKDGVKNAETHNKTYELLHGIMVNGLTAAGVRVNTPPKSLLSTISATLPGIKSEVMLHHLSSRGIYVSSGSACSSHHPGISRALTAYGLSDIEADCTVRISIGPQNTEQEAAYLVENIAAGVKTLIKKYRQSAI